MLHQVRTHPVFVDGCFGCKAATVNLSNGQIRAWAHGNEKELSLYAGARKQGIQPRSTRTKDITAAVRASDRAGRAVTVR
jgi:acylphosphatase